MSDVLFGRSGSRERVRVGAVVVAAGSGRRMGGVNKLLLELDGEPVLAYTLSALERCACIDEIVLVCREEDMPDYLRIAEVFAIQKLRSIVLGGSTRQRSVFAGVRALSESCDYYCIHDGARPLVTPAVVQRCLEAAQQYGCATAGVRVKDTIKRVSPAGVVVETPPRELLYAVQTPQIFRSDLYRRAMEEALADGLDCTDDCQLIEALGEEVYIAQGDYRNLKLTTPEDLAVAEAFLEEMQCE